MTGVKRIQNVCWFQRANRKSMKSNDRKQYQARKNMVSLQKANKIETLPSARKRNLDFKRQNNVDSKGLKEVHCREQQERNVLKNMSPVVRVKQKCKLKRLGMALCAGWEKE